MTSQQFWYLIFVAFISAASSFFGNWLSARNTKRASENALEAVNRQMTLQGASKIAEFRQAWINGLRDAMASYQSFGVTPDLNQEREREFYKCGTLIELMMNRDDPHYRELQEVMENFRNAQTLERKFECDEPYIRVCQDILRTEWKVLKLQMKAAMAGEQSTKQISN